MMKSEKDSQFAAHMPGIIKYHETMLSDGVRNALLYRAIKKHVNAATSFLDVGAGTGVWAILAAKLGAKRVVAVEIEEYLIPIIYKHAQENGVADRIEIIHGDTADVKLKGKFDVIVSELFGADAISKKTIESFVDLRTRFLHPNGILIPQRLINYVVPVNTGELSPAIPAKLPISSGYFNELRLNFPRFANLDERKKLKFLGKPKNLIELDFTSIDTAPSLKLSAEWKLPNVSKVNAIAMLTRSLFDEGIEMDGFDSQSWGTTIYRFDPIPGKNGTLRFEIDMDVQQSIWSVTTLTPDGNSTRAYSPSFANARIKLHQQMTPRRTARSSKKAK